MDELRKTICLTSKLKLLARSVCKTDGMSLGTSNPLKITKSKINKDFPNLGGQGFFLWHHLWETEVEENKERDMMTAASFCAEVAGGTDCIDGKRRKVL